MAAGRLTATIAAQALAFGLVAIVLIAWGISDHGRIRARGGWIIAVALTAALWQFLLMRAFATPGAYYIFSASEFWLVAAFCLAGIVLARGRPDLRGLEMMWIIYAAVTAVDWAIPNDIGGNVIWLPTIFALPLLMIPLWARGFRPRWLLDGLVAVVGVLQAVPKVNNWQAATTISASRAGFWAPALSYLRSHNAPGYRVEVVQSERYRKADYVAGAGYPLARGWFRQDGSPGNAVLYGAHTPSAYRSWLRRLGVRYVLLPSDPLDWSSLAEAAMLRGGRSGLDVAARAGGVTIYALPDPTPIVTPAADASLIALTYTDLRLQVRHAGLPTLRIHFTPYWTADGSAQPVCVGAGRGTSGRAPPRHGPTAVGVQPCNRGRRGRHVGSLCGRLASPRTACRECPGSPPTRAVALGPRGAAAVAADPAARG